MPATSTVNRGATPERQMTMFGAIAIWIGLELAIGGLAVGAVSHYLAPAEAQGVIAVEEVSSPQQG